MERWKIVRTGAGFGCEWGGFYPMKSWMRQQRIQLFCYNASSARQKSFVPPLTIVPMFFGSARKLWLIGYIDGDVVKREIALLIACHINDTHTEIGIGEVANCP